jgi:hypothetical protein
VITKKLLEGFQEFLAKLDMALGCFIYQMGCAVGAVDFFASANFAVAFAACFELGAPVAVS